MSLDDDLAHAAETAASFAASGERVEAVLAAEPASGQRVYLCSFDGEDGRTWLALGADGRALTSRAEVREAVSISALCEIADEFAGVETAPRLATPGYLDALVRDLPAHVPAATPVRARKRWIVAVMGHVVRQGRWRVAECTWVVNAMANSVLDLREAVLSSPEVELRVLAAMGNVSIIVPTGVDVELDAVALLGNRTDLTRSAAKPGAPVVRITGLVVMGNVIVRHA